MHVERVAVLDPDDDADIIRRIDNVTQIVESLTDADRRKIVRGLTHCEPITLARAKRAEGVLALCFITLDHQSNPGYWGDAGRDVNGRPFNEVFAENAAQRRDRILDAKNAVHSIIHTIKGERS